MVRMDSNEEMGQQVGVEEEEAEEPTLLRQRKWLEEGPQMLRICCIDIKWVEQTAAFPCQSLFIM